MSRSNLDRINIKMTGLISSSSPDNSFGLSNQFSRLFLKLLMRQSLYIETRCRIVILYPLIKLYEGRGEPY